jgi:hypothetical protein
MKFGILRERRVHQTEVVFPTMNATYKERYKDAFIQVESSDIRIFTDAQYSDLEVSDDISDCDVLFGVKSSCRFLILISLISFSHTIKQPLTGNYYRQFLKKHRFI